MSILCKLRDPSCMQAAAGELDSYREQKMKLTSFLVHCVPSYQMEESSSPLGPRTRQNEEFVYC